MPHQFKSEEVRINFERIYETTIKPTIQKSRLHATMLSVISLVDAHSNEIPEEVALEILTLLKLHDPFVYRECAITALAFREASIHFNREVRKAASNDSINDVSEAIAIIQNILSKGD